MLETGAELKALFTEKCSSFLEGAYSLILDVPKMQSRKFAEDIKQIYRLLDLKYQQLESPDCEGLQNKEFLRNEISQISECILSSNLKVNFPKMEKKILREIAKDLPRRVEKKEELKMEEEKPQQRRRIVIKKEKPKDLKVEIMKRSIEMMALPSQEFIEVKPANLYGEKVIDITIDQHQHSTSITLPTQHFHSQFQKGNLQEQDTSMNVTNVSGYSNPYRKDGISEKQGNKRVKRLRANQINRFKNNEDINTQELASKSCNLYLQDKSRNIRAGAPQEMKRESSPMGRNGDWKTVLTRNMHRDRRADHLSGSRKQDYSTERSLVKQEQKRELRKDTRRFDNKEKDKNIAGIQKTIAQNSENINTQNLNYMSPKNHQKIVKINDRENVYYQQTNNQRSKSNNVQKPQINNLTSNRNMRSRSKRIKRFQPQDPSQSPFQNKANIKQDNITEKDLIVQTRREENLPVSSPSNNARLQTTNYKLDSQLQSTKYIQNAQRLQVVTPSSHKLGEHSLQRTLDYSSTSFLEDFKNKSSICTANQQNSQQLKMEPSVFSQIKHSVKDSLATPSPSPSYDLSEMSLQGGTSLKNCFIPSRMHP